MRRLLVLFVVSPALLIAAAPRPRAASQASARPPAPATAKAAEPAADKPAPPAINAIGWGVVTAYEAEVYDRSGTLIGKIQGGETFELLKEITANKQPAYYVMLRDKTQRLRDKAYLRGILLASNAAIYRDLPNPDDAASIDFFNRLRTQLSEYYSTKALRQSLIERARAQHLAKSPAKQLPELRKELAAVPAKDRAYEAAQKAAKTNAERLRYLDLRKELSYRTTGMQQESKRLEASVEAWEKTHPFDETPIRKKGTWKRLTQRLHEMEPALRPYGVQPVED